FLQMDIRPEDRKNQGLQAVLQSIFPIYDFNNNSSLEFAGFTFGEPKYSEEECRERDMTYSAALKVTLRLVVREEDPDTKIKRIKDIKEQEVFFCELPLMTSKGTFIINGAERVIVSQLHRSPGVSFDEDEAKTASTGKRFMIARIIPYWGSWLEMEFDNNDLLYVRIDRKRKILVTTLLRAIGYTTQEKIIGLFYESESIPAKEQAVNRILTEDVVHEASGEILAECNTLITPEVLQRFEEAKIKKLTVAKSGPDEALSLYKTLAKDSTRSKNDALIEIYRKMRPGDPPTVESASALLESLFFNPKRYNLSRVGRYKLNKRLGLHIPLDHCTLKKEDIVEIIRHLILLNNQAEAKDDIDHLGNRRVRSSGELLENQFRIGLARIERAVKERMSILEIDTCMPSNLINAKPVAAGVKEFFGSSQLSQFMDQTNPLAELTHKRRLSALGPGGLNRERAGFEVRDVHHTHYGRICPIETPEGPNIGLISSLATFARVNEFGFIETPYRKVVNGRVTDEIHYLVADEEDNHVIAQANAAVDDKGNLVGPLIAARFKADYPLVNPKDVDYMDVSPKQLVSVASALIPFLEHDDANRALMGSNMQRQAVPLLRTEAPFVGTGMEEKAAYDSGVMVISQHEGVVERVSADKIIISWEDKKEGRIHVDTYNLLKYQRSNQDTCVNQKPIVLPGQHVKRGQVIADGPATDGGELALGQNILVAFMPWQGYNFEDAIIVSERLLKDDFFTSVHVEEFELEARDTKLGKEEITRDIPNVGEEALKDLDESGIVRIGAEVGPGDILVGKVTPKGETELSPEEKLLRAIFGEKSGDVRDASLKVPPGVEGKVIEVKVFSRRERDDKIRVRDIDQIKKIEKERMRRVGYVDKRRDEDIAELEKKLSETLAEIKKSGKGDAQAEKEKVAKRIFRLKQIAEEMKEEINREQEKRILKIRKGDELPPGVIKLVKVLIAKKRKLSVGDKMAGRHGNKGVVSKIVPVEDMPYLADGTPIDIILNPLGVPSRMNLGQILETHLGWAACKLNQYIASPVFDGATQEQIKEILEQAKLPKNGTTTLFDGRHGEAFDCPITVGYIYMLKLAHLVDDKIHARSIGPYSLITQQPLGGKAQFGGQRFGEMEVWALEAYGAAEILQELLTVKSDDTAGRTKIYEAIVKGKPAPESCVPESFNVLVKELQSLALNIELLRRHNDQEGQEEVKSEEKATKTKKRKVAKEDA
ncbi:DNA-directed RNA polymerase subunit beta, partial [candidate division FCPU426 bacterium]|nr:DNA-directed RNA polymerase subunit beta [candidate division FCPU426 bacterium]